MNLRVVTDELEQNRSILVGHAESFVRNVGDLLGIRILEKAEAFHFLRLLANLDPDIASAERLRHNSHIDFYMATSPITCGRDGLRVGEAHLEILSLKESPHSTFPNVLRDLLALETNLHPCTEVKRVLNDHAITTIRVAQKHFTGRQWVADIPSIISTIVNCGNRET